MRGAPIPEDVAAWRTAERRRLIAARVAVDAADHKLLSGRIAQHLATYLGSLKDRVISGYWPMRGEPDLMPWMAGLERQGAQCVLPVVTMRGAPMSFRPWRKGAPTIPGVWKIPVPATDETIEPDIVLAPVVGFDRACFRLGYGGGYFDRTLAVLQPRATAIGIGFAGAETETIRPQPHDIPMTVIITENGPIGPASPPPRATGDVP